MLTKKPKDWNRSPIWVKNTRKYRVLKDIYVQSGPPFILPKGSIVVLYKSPHHEKPVVGRIFTDKRTQETIDENWKVYLQAV